MLKDLFNIFLKNKDSESEVIEEENPNKDLIEELSQIKYNKQLLMLEKIDLESETIKRHLDGLTKDIDKYLESKEKIELHTKNIYSKIRKITVHELEIRNLLTSLEDHYFKPLIDIAYKMQKRLYKAELNLIITGLKKDLEIVIEIEKELSKLIAHNELLNPDKNPEYRKAIEKELSRKTLNVDIKMLSGKILNVVLDKTRNVKLRAEHNDIIDRLSFML